MQPGANSEQPPHTRFPQQDDSELPLNGSKQPGEDWRERVDCAAAPACEEWSASLLLQNSILNELADVVWSVDLNERRYLYMNAAAQRLYGRPASDFLHDMALWLKVIHPEDRPGIEAVFQEIHTVGRQDLEYRIVRPDGEVRWVRDRAQLVRGEAGHPIRIDGLVTDITEHKRMDAELQQRMEYEQFLGAIAQRIHQSFDVLDILNATLAETRHLLNADRTLIYSFQSYEHNPIIAESVDEGWKALLNTPIPTPDYIRAFQDQYRYGHVTVMDDVSQVSLAPDHRALLHQFQIRAAMLIPIFCRDTLWGLLIIHQCSDARQWHSTEVDLAQRLCVKLGIAIQQAELFQQVQHLNANLESQVEDRTHQLRELLDFESLLKRMTDKVRDSLDEHQILQTAVQELAIQLDLEACNCAVYDLEQQTSTVRYEHVQRGIPTLGSVWQMTEFPEFYEQLLRDDTCFQFCACHRKLGWVAIMACPVWDDRGVLGDLWLLRRKEQWFSESEIRLIQQVVLQCAIAMRQARLYQEVQQQVSELETLNQLKDDFLSTVSHELRTPLASIKMASQMLEVTLMRQSLLEEDDAPLSRYLRVLQEECDREMQLVNDLLDLSRLEAQRVPLMLVSIPLPIWIPHLAESFAPRIQQQQCQLVFDIPDDLPAIVSDMGLLERVMIELLNNACKYTPPQETIKVQTRYDAHHVWLEIRNSGVEIPEESRSHLFDKFYRVPSTDPWKQGGTGLGLALVKRIVAQLQGTIELLDEPGCTTFLICLPRELGWPSETPAIAQ